MPLEQPIPIRQYMLAGRWLSRSGFHRLRDQVRDVEEGAFHRVRDRARTQEDRERDQRDVSRDRITDRPEQIAGLELVQEHAASYAGMVVVNALMVSAIGSRAA